MPQEPADKARALQEAPSIIPLAGIILVLLHPTKIKKGLIVLEYRHKKTALATGAETACRHSSAFVMH